MALATHRPIFMAKNDGTSRLLGFLADENEDSEDEEVGEEVEDAPGAEGGVDEDTGGCCDGDTGW
ncbi:hypothetical protein M885DRAFT_558916 [Pelagophyceae sp. CCMP2097]|nr:hypothetical protein M885DRAFT_558916 [Pelagophyceae sp. CCMP2097]